MVHSFVRLDAPSTIAFIAVLALVVIAVPAVSALFASKRRVYDDRPRAKHLRYARTILVLWTVTLIAWYALRLHGQSIADVGVRAPDLAIAYVVGPAISIIWLLLGTATRRRSLPPDYARGVRAIVPTNRADWFWFVPVAASAALCEEFLYRGFALTQIAQLTGSVALGVVISSLAFGLGHAYQGRLGMALVTVLGLIYSALFVTFDSLAPSVLAHFVQDIAAAAITARVLARSPMPAVGSAGRPEEYVATSISRPHSASGGDGSS
jgi:uncharacterized protein